MSIATGKIKSCIMREDGTGYGFLTDEAGDILLSAHVLRAGAAVRARRGDEMTVEFSYGPRGRRATRVLSFNGDVGRARHRATRGAL